MQKCWLLILIVVLVSCKREIEFESTDAVSQMESDSRFTARTEIRLLEKKFSSALGVQVHGFGAFEVYWDSVKIGQNGIPASPGKAEVPGTETSYYQVPDALSGLGLHIVELRGTQQHLKETGRRFAAKPESYLRLLRQPLIELSLVNLMAGAFLIASVYYVFLYFNSKVKMRTTLLFAVVCFLFFTLLIIEYLKFYIDIPYTQFYTRLIIVGWLTFSIATLIPLYFAIHFDLPYRPLFITAVVAALLIVYIVNYDHYDLTAHLYSLLLWIASVFVLVFAVVKKQKGASLVLAGFALSMLVNQYIFYDFGLYISFTILLLCILYLQTIRAKLLEEEHQASLLLSSRLQLELVRKNIQPHFLRNTLTSLIDWVEEEPAQGVLFIQALAAEFDIMNEISEKALIPIRQEIELCRHHLHVMEFRKELRYVWLDEGIVDTELIPPAIIHTLLENGISHNVAAHDGRMKFKLGFSREAGFKQYVFETFARSRLDRQRPGGNGFRYIRARLNESYGSGWTFTSGPFDQGWRSIIRIPE